MALEDDLSRLMPGWTVERPLGEGGFGSVHLIKKEGPFGQTSWAALKVVRIPRSSAEVRELRTSGWDDRTVSDYLDRKAQDFSQEIDAMLRLKGEPGIVAIEEQAAEKNPEGFGWTIYIRMELLEPLTDHLLALRSAQNPLGLMAEPEVVRLGVEVARALVLCHGLGIVHRDIKPANIFVTRQGSFKLGDFGIARRLESVSQAMSTAMGTPAFLAPEVVHNQPYDATVDIYSLGLLLYRQANLGRLPFENGQAGPGATTGPRGSLVQSSSPLARRLSGERLPPPAAASPSLARVILKACAYRPQDRYGTAAELLRELEALASAPESASARTSGCAPAPGAQRADAGARAAAPTQGAPTPGPRPGAAQPGGQCPGAGMAPPVAAASAAASATGARPQGAQPVASAEGERVTQDFTVPVFTKDAPQGTPGPSAGAQGTAGAAAGASRPSPSQQGAGSPAAYGHPGASGQPAGASGQPQSAARQPSGSGPQPSGSASPSERPVAGGAGSGQQEVPSARGCRDLGLWLDGVACIAGFPLPGSAPNTSFLGSWLYSLRDQEALAAMFGEVKRKAEARSGVRVQTLSVALPASTTITERAARAPAARPRAKRPCRTPSGRPTSRTEGRRAATRARCC